MVIHGGSKRRAFTGTVTVGADTSLEDTAVLWVGKTKSATYEPQALNDDGKALVKSSATADVKKGRASIANTNSTEVIASPGETKKLFITDIQVTNGSTSVGTWVRILDGATIIWRGFAAADGGGFAINLTTPLVLTTNNALNAVCETDASDVEVCASGYQGD